MHCPACGKSLARRTKYCTHCGEQLRLEDTTAIEKLEKRFDERMESLFWTIVLGLGAIIGGTAALGVINEGLHFGPWLIIGYITVSSLAFLTMFGIYLREVIMLAKRKSSLRGDAEEEPFDTNELVEAKAPRSLEEAISVTDDTTRTLETRGKERVPR